MAKIRYDKILAVVILTVLIWVWADLAITEDYTISGAVLRIAKSTNPNLLASFGEESTVSIEEIVVKGPASRIADVKRRLNEGSLVLDFFLVPEQAGMDEPKTHTLPVPAFLRKNVQIRDLGLSIVSCEPQTLSVDVVQLKKKLLTIKCVDENNDPVRTVSIEPKQIEMFVPESWEGDALVATVSLTERELEQARITVVGKVPFVVLPGRQIRQADKLVKIRAQARQDRLEDYFITATLSIALSPALQGKYKVEITNLEQVLSVIPIRATAQAKRAYELQEYPPMTLYILSDDRNTTDEQKRKVVYNFPAEFINKDEIELKGPAVEARFKLIPLNSAEAP